MSCYAPQNRHSESFHIRTDADFVTVAVPLEAAGHIGIHASPTRITDRILYLTEALRLQAVEDGIRHYGNSVFTGSLSSEFFSPKYFRKRMGCPPEPDDRRRLRHIRRGGGTP